ncbi:MAG: adenylosuccinate lyase, partial [Desulfamplus sp.]|nr:adenylosuccinate lyase [Desulfamplus sp.]
MGNIKALSVFDGRYAKTVEPLTEIFSEYGLIQRRIHVEIQWLQFLSGDLELFGLDENKRSVLDSIVRDFDEASAMRVKEIERGTNHDVKAVEYFIKERLGAQGFSSIQEWVH